MTGLQTLFPRSSFVGFDHLFNELEFTAKHAQDHYPPHNIIKLDDTHYTIEIAVAGFTQDELAIEAIERTLTVTGTSRPDEDKPGAYIHRGISTRRFKRVFRLSEYVEVAGALLKDGILSVYLKVEIPDERRPRKIDISI